MTLLTPSSPFKLVLWLKLSRGVIFCQGWVNFQREKWVSFKWEFLGSENEQKESKTVQN